MKDEKNTFEFEKELLKFNNEIKEAYEKNGYLVKRLYLGIELCLNLKFPDKKRGLHPPIELIDYTDKELKNLISVEHSFVGDKNHDFSDYIIFYNEVGNE